MCIPTYDHTNSCACCIYMYVLSSECPQFSAVNRRCTAQEDQRNDDSSYIYRNIIMFYYMVAILTINTTCIYAYCYVYKYMSMLYYSYTVSVRVGRWYSVGRVSVF